MSSYFEEEEEAGEGDEDSWKVDVDEQGNEIKLPKEGMEAGNGVIEVEEEDGWENKGNKEEDEEKLGAEEEDEEDENEDEDEDVEWISIKELHRKANQPRREEEGSEEEEEEEEQWEEGKNKNKGRMGGGVGGNKKKGKGKARVMDGGGNDDEIEAMEGDQWIGEMEEGMEDHLSIISENLSSIGEEWAEDEYQLQKFEQGLDARTLVKMHPEIRKVCQTEVEALSRIVRDEKGRIVDPLHKMTEMLTKYEKAKIIGVRHQQLMRGARPMINQWKELLPDYGKIAERELKQKKLPFIIVRAYPNNGGKEYWKLNDLIQM